MGWIERWVGWALVLNCVGCGGAGFPRPAPEVVEAARASGADAYEWSRRYDVRFEPGAKGPIMRERLRRRVVVVTDDAGSATRLVKHTSKDLSTIEAWEVVAWLPDGTTREYSLEDFADVPAIDGFQLYDDTRARVLVLDVPPGTVIDSDRRSTEYDMRVTVFRTFVERPDPVRALSITVSAPEAWTVTHTGRRLMQPITLRPDAKRIEAGHRVLTWRFANLPALEKTPFGASVWQRTRRLVVRLAQWQTGEGWHDANEMAAAMAAPYRALRTVSNEAAAIARDLVKGAPDAREKARRVTEWVRDTIRYCSISIGLGGWVPHAAQSAFAQRYGDCKDQATLTTGMLHAVGVSADAALVHTHRGLPSTFEAPVLGANYNHAIVRVNLDPPQYFDPTRKTVPFGELGHGIAGAQVLPLAPDGDLEWLPEADGVRRLTARLAFTGLSWAGEGRFSATGTFAHRLRARARKGKARRLRGVQSTLRPFDVKTVEAYTDPARAQQPIEVQTRLTLEQPGVGTPIVLTAGLIGRSFERTPAVDADGPVLLGTPGTRAHRIAFEWPHPVELPADVELSIPAGRYQQRWRVEDGAVVLDRSLNILERVADRTQAAAWIAAIRATEVRPVVLAAP